MGYKVQGPSVSCLLNCHKSFDVSFCIPFFSLPLSLSFLSIPAHFSHSFPLLSLILLVYFYFFLLMWDFLIVLLSWFPLQVVLQVFFVSLVSVWVLRFVHVLVGRTLAFLSLSEDGGVVETNTSEISICLFHFIGCKAWLGLHTKYLGGKLICQIRVWISFSVLLKFLSRFHLRTLHENIYS